MQAVCAVAN